MWLVPFYQLIIAALGLVISCILIYLRSQSQLIWFFNIFNAIFTEWVTSCWCVSYFNIVKGAKLEFKKLYEESAAKDLDRETLRKLWSKYLVLFCAVKKINAVFGINMLFCFSYVYIWLMSDIYSLVHGLLHPGHDKIEKYSLALWMCLQLFKLSLLTYQPQKCLDYVRKFKSRIAFYSSDSDHLEEVRQLQLFSPT